MAARNDGAAGSGQQPGPGSRSLPSSDLITQPKNGQYPVVVVGASLEDEYPEIFELWSGRVAYTVYLPVGLTKSWILQYSLSRSALHGLSENAAPLEAPWPVEIVRPRLAPDDFTSNAIVLHGFVNATGHFESLSVVYPARFQYDEFLVNILGRWVFRPATLSGQATAVEVVLVIPQDGEMPK
jgi:hypothetical protein